MQLLFSGAIPGPADVRGVKALLGVVDAGSGELIYRCEYETPVPLRAPVQKMQFTGSARDGDRLYVCTHNEVVWFDDWPPTEPAGRVVRDDFNDLHHCLPWKGGLLVVNTGLETLDHVALDGELICRWDLLEGIEGARQIDPQVSYRDMDDQALKPHRVHGNHVFVRGNDLWVTQLRASRAISVTDGGTTLEFEAGMPHDGRYIGDRIAFTTTNGHVVMADPSSLEVTSHNLVDMTPGATILGWCRGLCEDPRGRDRYFVAFSSQRATRWREYAFWAKYKHKQLPSRIASYDIGRGELRESFDVTPELMSLAIFQIDLLPEARWI